MKNYFPDNSYYTIPDSNQKNTGNFVKNQTTCFYLKLLRILYKSNRLAVKNQLDNSNCVLASFEVMKLIEQFGGRFVIEGLDNIKNEKKPVVFLSNHMSTLETFTFPCIIASQKKTTFVVKESLVSYPLFGPIMRSREPIVVTRSNSRRDFEIVMNQGQKLLEQGISVIIFPQKTRKVRFAPEEFNSLGVKLAAKADVPVIPVAIKTDFWGQGKLIKDFGPIKPDNTIYMTFEKAMHIKNKGKEEHMKIINFISSKLEEWKNVRQ